MWRARPLPEPHGMMPSAVSEPQSAIAVSLTVPSPPAAMTMSEPSAMACRAKSVASPGPVVNLVSTLMPTSASREVTRSARPFFLPVPEMGLIISKAFLVSITGAKLRNLNEREKLLLPYLKLLNISLILLGGKVNIISKICFLNKKQVRHRPHNLRRRLPPSARKRSPHLHRERLLSEENKVVQIIILE